MSTTISKQHPAVVLRSHFQALRALLAVAMIAVVGLTAAVVILAVESEPINPSAESPNGSVRHGDFSRVAPGVETAPQPGVRYDGGPDEGTRGIVAQPPAARYDGGPEEGTADTKSAMPPATRYDGGPEEGSADISSAQPPAARYDGGPEEGTRGPGFNTN